MDADDLMLALALVLMLALVLTLNLALVLMLAHKVCLLLASSHDVPCSPSVLHYVRMVWIGCVGHWSARVLRGRVCVCARESTESCVCQMSEIVWKGCVSENSKKCVRGRTKRMCQGKY